MDLERNAALHRRAVLMFCTNIGKNKDLECKPLEPREWRMTKESLALCREPMDFLLEATFDELSVFLPGEIAKRIANLRTGRRLQEEISALAKEEHICIFTEADAIFPHGCDISWPFLFCKGDASLLADLPHNSVAIVGARDADENTLRLAANIAELCSMKDLCVLSGGANGIDACAQLSAIKAEGRTVAVLPYGLKSKQAVYLQKRLCGSYLLISAAAPKQGFSTKLAMSRNAMIYGMTKAAFVIGAKEGKGGTWSGARAALRKEKMFINVFRGFGKGNDLLEASGAKQWDIEENFNKRDLEKNLEIILENNLNLV